MDAAPGLPSQRLSIIAVGSWFSLDEGLVSATAFASQWTDHPFMAAKMKQTVDSDDELDLIDLNILRHLQSNGRLTNADLAIRVNISAATCHRRTQRLFRKKAIRDVRAIIDPAAIDLEVVVMVGVVLDRSTPESFAAFEKAVKTLSFVIECHLIAGDFDYFLKIRVSSMQAFNRLHGNHLLTLPGVRQTRTFFVMKEVTDNAPLAF